MNPNNELINMKLKSITTLFLLVVGLLSQAQLPDMIKDKSNFIAVDAAHLVGVNGLIQLLKNKGYTITPKYSVK